MQHEAFSDVLFLLFLFSCSLTHCFYHFLSFLLLLFFLLFSSSSSSRETDWLFSSDYGRKQLAESAGFDRLVIVTLHRGHTYHGIERVKEEVSDKALELAQENLPEKRKVIIFIRL